MMLVSLISRGGDWGAGFWRKTSSKSSCGRPVELSNGFCWSEELKKLDSEIRSEDRWRMYEWEDDNEMLLLSFLFGVSASWK